ncbi:DUF402 domain-containing protein [Actinoplanes sp. NPDC051411]|jgi:hypothetical protein|uniref:DUF402 domain-containing protein n=1 Tax=Actinoplanes sp. NPDC051411 TaxID=3155522 RepID=UPI003443EB5C
MLFAPGRVVLRRYFRASTYSFVKPMVVVRDDEAGLLLWMPAGTGVAGLEDQDSRNLHAVSLGEMREPRLVRKTWGENDVLILMPPGAAHSVWWFFRQAEFAGWYVNLETPSTRHDEGVDATDLVLDVVVAPDRTWVWKDEDEMADRIGRPDYFDRDGADEIRAEGERVIKLIEAGDYPFDGTWTDFRPDPAWPAPTLPVGWDRPGPNN